MFIVAVAGGLCVGGVDAGCSGPTFIAETQGDASAESGGDGAPLDAPTSDASDAADATETADGCAGPHDHLNPANGRCYRFEGFESTWGSSETQCGVLGGHLASIGDVDEHAFVLGIINQEHDAAGGTWIGLNRLDGGVWQWSSGEALTYTHWGPSNPTDGAVAKDCVGMYGAALSGNWDNFPCTNAQPAVCER